MSRISGDIRIIGSDNMPSPTPSHSSYKREPEVFSPSMGDRFDKNTMDLKGNYQQNPPYPTLAKKMFQYLEDLEKTVKSLGENPTPDEVKDSGVRDFSRWMVPLSKAYKDSYDHDELKSALKPLQGLSYMAGQFKDIALVEEEVAKISPGGVIPSRIRKKLEEFRREKTQEFMDYFKKFKEKDLQKSIEILRNPYPMPKMTQKEAEEEDRSKLSRCIQKLVDQVEHVGLFHEDPEEFHEGRKTLRNLMGMLLQTKDVFPYRQEDEQALKQIFKTYGKSQDKHIAHQWLLDNGFKKEADIMGTQQKESQKYAMEMGKEFIKSGVLENIRQSAR